MTPTIDFSEALRLMRSGIPVKRLAWDGKTPVDRKYKVEITVDGRLRTTFLNYSSDRAVLSADDLLAKDWVEVEL